MKAAALDDKTLNRECSVFSIYLIGQPPSEYVMKKYREAHQTGIFRGGAAQPVEDFLVRFASVGPWSTKIIDTYARVFRPFSLVRKKLVLLLAILESCAPTHAYLDSVDSNSTPLLFLQFFHRCLTFVLIVVISVLVILPAELILRGSARRRVLWQPRNG
jgi:hypothetical protein